MRKVKTQNHHPSNNTGFSSHQNENKPNTNILKVLTKGL